MFSPHETGGGMIDIGETDRRRIFSVWLRTGRLPTEQTGGIELKFNPYHDPRNGQFTFAPGGPRLLSRVIISHGRSRPSGPQKPGGTLLPSSETWIRAQDGLPVLSEPKPILSDAVYRPSEADADLRPARSFRAPRSIRGSNSRAFEDPMLLEQAFPGLQNAPGGAIIAVADSIFDLSGPARAALAELNLARTRVLIEQIEAVDPTYRFQSLGFPQTLQGQLNRIDGLRFDRAAALLRVKGEARPMQVETLRFLQKRTDLAYERGLRLLKAGGLPVRLSEQEALGNYIDREVRRDLRFRYNQSEIDSAGKGPVRVNRRENDTSGSDTTFRQPDARVGSVAYDVTLTRKTLQTAQVRGFFATDFQPGQVVIVRPRQIGSDSTYVITRPETKQ